MGDKISLRSIQINAKYMQMIGLSPECTETAYIIVQQRVMKLHVTCADPEGGTGGPDPPWNLKILPKKRLFQDFLVVGPPLVCDQKLPFSLDPLS